MSTASKVIVGVVVGVIAILIIGLLAGGSDEKDEMPSVRGEESGAAASVEQSSAAPTEPPEEPSLPTNQARIGNLLLTVNGFAAHNDELFAAEPGTHYIAVDVTAKNVGDENYSLNVLNFRLQDSDKFTGTYALTSGPDPQIGAHTMVPGQEVRGYIVFKLGDGREPRELQYQSFTGSAGTIPVR